MTMATSSERRPVRVPGMYTCEQAAAKLRMKPDTIRRYINRGLIQAGTLAGIWLISEAELDRFKANRRGRGNPDFVQKRA